VRRNNIETIGNRPYDTLILCGAYGASDRGFLKLLLCSSLLCLCLEAADLTSQCRFMKEALL
jgi:hypothetical protein